MIPTRCGNKSFLSERSKCTDAHSLKDTLHRPCNCSNLDIWTSFFSTAAHCVHRFVVHLKAYRLPLRDVSTVWQSVFTSACSSLPVAMLRPCPSVAKLTCLRHGLLLIWLIDCFAWQTENFDSVVVMALMAVVLVVQVNVEQVVY